MARTLYAFIASLASFHATSQPILQYPGTPTETLQFNAFLAADPGEFSFTPGASQTWNALSVTLTPSGSATLGPATGPEAANYPNADRMLQVTSSLLPVTDHTFLSTSASALSLVATNVPRSPRVYTDPRDLIRFPLEFQDQFTDTYQVNDPEETTMTYSGYGTLITSTGIYGNVALLSDDDGKFMIWNTAPLYPLVMSEGNGFLLFDRTDEVGMPENTLGHQPFNHDRAGDILRIVTTNTAGQWRITDASGRIVSNGQVAHSSNTGISLGHLPAGLYVASLNSTSGSASMKFVKD